MAGSYPTGVTTYTNPGPTDTTATVIGGRTHDQLHGDVQDDLEQVMTKLGTGASTAATNTVLRGTGAGTTAFGQIVSADITDGTIVDADLNASAAVALTKLAHVGANNVLKSNGTANVGGQVVNADIADGTIQAVKLADAHLRKLAEISGTGSSGVLEFASIPATYRELQVTLIGRSDAAGTAGATIALTFETTPTAGSYNLVALQGAAGAATSPEQYGLNNTISAGQVPTAGNPASIAGTTKIFLPEYANTNFFKSVSVLANHMTDLVSGPGTGLRVSHGVWESTAAIDRIRLSLAAGNWTTASRATLWGMPS